MLGSKLRYSYFILIVISICFHLAKGESGFEYNTDTSTSTPTAEKRLEPKVKIKPPSKLATFFISSNNIYLIWDPPLVYPVHDVDLNDTNWMDENSTSWIDNKFDSVNLTQIVNSTKVSLNTSMSNDETPNNDSSTKTSLVNICRPYAYFSNRTMYGDYKFNVMGSIKNGQPYVRPQDKEEHENNSITISINEAMVPFSKGCIEEYIVYILDNNTGKNVQTRKVQGDKPTEINITGLQASTEYKLIIAAEFTSGHKLNSTSLVVRTKPNNDKKECRCDPIGTIGGKQNCYKDGTSMCFCKPGYNGLFCEVCQPGFYKTAPFFPCHVCPCASHAAVVRSCHFLEGFLVCKKCRTGYTGNLCHQCANGFHRHKAKYCIPCNCHGNTDPNSPMMCDPYTGACSSCIRNTTGFNCERCRKGFLGDAIIHKNCTHESDVVKANSLPLPAGYIGGIVVGVILILCLIAGAVVYKHWNHPAMKPFWTVELKEDHEGVNFSPVEDQEFLNHVDAVREGQFYEKQGGRGMKYAQLREDI